MFSYYRRSFRNLLVSLKGLYVDNTDLEHLQHIQDRLYERLLYIESRIHAVRRKMKELKSAVRHGRRCHEHVRTLKGEIADLQSRIIGYQRLLCIFRLIGDGLVYTYFSKWDVKLLAFRESAGFLSGKRGCRFERRVVRDANGKGVPAIQTDLTNCIRYGDVCFFDEVPRLVEVKSGSLDSPRVARQLASIERINNHLRSDVVVDSEGVPWLKRVTPHAEEVNHIDAINRVIQQARVNHHGYASPEEGLHYMAARGGPDDFLSSVLSKVDRPILFFLNDMKNRQHWASYYPFTLSVKSPDDVIDFIEGNLIIAIIVDGTVLVKHFASRGYSVSLLNDRVVSVEISSLSTTGGKDMLVQCSIHFIYRIALEFVSLVWMVDEMISIYRNAEAHPLRASAK